MSNQYSRNKKQQHQNWNSNNKTQKIFVPKIQNRTTENPNPTLSNSLRQSQLKESNASGTSSSASVSGESSRIRVGENGDWVASKAGAANGGKFVNYLPQDEAVAAGLGADEGGMDPVESQRVVDLLNRELSRLLKLSPRGFWKEVATDTSLHGFLDSFLQFKSRWYDFPNHGAKGILAGVIVGEPELSRRVFMVLYRISSNMDPGARPSESLSLKDHGVLLQEKNLLDLPKLLDICAIYGHENEDLTRLLIRNALKAQPWIHDNMTSLISHFLGIVHTMHQRCCSSLETLLSPENHDHGSSLLLADFIEAMDFINDAVASLDAFVAVYKPAAVFFSCPVGTSYGNEELLGTFAKLHDSLLPSLRRGFQILVMEGDGEMISNISMNLKMLSMRIVNLGWKLLDMCYLSDEMLEDGLPTPAITKMFPAEVEDPVVRADILVQTFREINGVSIQEKDNQKLDTFLQNVEKKYNMMKRLESLQNSGWVIMDDEQFHYISGIMISSSKGALIGSTLAPTPVPTNKVHMDEDAAIMESKISQIKDLFPDYGKGFLAACLEAYNHNPEEVIERILEGTLHEDLQCLDTSLETIPPSKSDPSINSKDKGKGKLVESTAVPSIKPVAVAGGKNVDGPSVSSSSTVGRFVRKSRDDLPDGNTLDARNENDTAKTAALISQYEYDDEYDDSFDDLGLSIAESRLDENEMMGDSVSSNMGKAQDIGTESSAQTASNRKWGSRKTPQFYVKDGKNYSYKVAGSVAVANADEASIVNQAQVELIHGLGRGGNLPLGAVKKLMAHEEQYNNQSDVSNAEGEGNSKNMSGRGGRGGRRPSEANEDQNSHSNNLEGNGRGDSANQRGRGGRRGGGRNSYQKDRSMRKHFAGLSGY